MDDLEPFSEQIERIKVKLPQARAADPACLVFGSKQHRYELGPPVAADTVTAFDARIGITLPAAYTAFVTQVGNGGARSGEAGAGPFYGLFALGTDDGKLIERFEHRLANPSPLRPGIEYEAWQETLRDLGNRTDEAAYLANRDRLFGGLLPLGHQGCGIYYELVLTGPHAGRIVNIDPDDQPPVFAHEANFLDYYERWLDEVIAGELQRNGPPFGYTLPGDDKALMAQFDRASDRQAQFQALHALSARGAFAPSTTTRLVELARGEDKEIAYRALDLLIDVAPAGAYEVLEPDLTGSPEQFCAAVKRIYEAGRLYNGTWGGDTRIRQVVIRRLGVIDDPLSFLCASSIVASGPAEDVAALEPYCDHTDPGIQTYAWAALSRWCANHPGGQGRFEARLLAGLGSDNASEISHALQGVSGLRGAAIEAGLLGVLESYAGVKRDGWSEGRIHDPLDARIAELGYSGRRAFARAHKSNAYRFWEFWKR